MKHSQQGFTLMEVMITFFVLSIGLLGMAALQIKSVHHSADAAHVSQANALIQEISDLIRLSGMNTFTDKLIYCTGGGGAAGGAGCSQSLLTDYEIWQQSIPAILPSSDTIIATGTAKCYLSGMCDMRVTWYDREDDAETSVHLNSDLL